MPRHREWDLKCKVYVGNLGSSASKHEIESAFQKYGPLKNVWVARNPPGFAFVEFDDTRDAEDAVRALDGTRVCGTRIRVEMSSGRSRGGRMGGGGPGRGGRDRDGGRGGGRYRSRSRSRSPRRARSYSRSASRSKSPVRSRGRRERETRDESRSPSSDRRPTKNRDKSPPSRRSSSDRSPAGKTPE